MSSDTAILRVRGASKTYPGVKALDAVDFELRAGEVRALLGKNGAGKSTLVKALSGVVTLDAGEIEIGGVRQTLTSPRDAQQAGVATVHQELSLVPEMSVVDNILLGSWHTRGFRPMGVLDRASMRRDARKVLDDLEVDVDLDAPVNTLSIAAQQVVEIARAIRERARILILDEPTSSLPAQEVDVLISLVRRLARAGVAVIYVSHRMAEIPRVAESVTVLRDGRKVATLPVGDAPTRHVVSLMTGTAGHDLLTPAVAEEGNVAQGPVALEVRDLRTLEKLDGIDLDLRKGEVLGLAGLLGSGRSELLRAIYGVGPPATGTVRVHGRPFVRRGPKQSIGRKVGFGPEDRKKDALVLELGLSYNLVLGALRRLRRGVALSGRAERSIAAKTARDLGIKAAGLRTAVGTLSGGNQQKVVMGKLLISGAEILLLDEPTRGVDIDAKRQIYALLRSLAGDGASVIFASSEVEELFEVCDRIVVLSHGRSVADLRPSETSVSDVMQRAMDGGQ